MKFDTIVFDLDGTLVDSSAMVINGFNYALSRFGISVSAAEVEIMRSRTSAELFRDRLTEAQANEALARLFEHSRTSASDTRILPGVKEMLENLAARKIKMGLWTGRDRASALAILRAHQIDVYFDAVVGGCEVKKNKPDAEGLLMLAQRLGAAVDKIVHVGDHAHDLQGACSAGVAFVHAQWHVPVAQTAPLTNLAFDSIHGFLPWIDNVFKA